MPRLVPDHVPRSGRLEDIDVRFAFEAVRHNAEEHHSRRRAVERVEINEDLGLDFKEAIVAPSHVAPGPEIRCVFYGVGRIECRGHPEMEVVWRPDLQPVYKDDLAIGVSLLLEQGESLFVLEPEITVHVRRRLWPRIPGERLEIAVGVLPINF